MSQIRVAETHAGTHDILVVDDEELVRRHWQQVLERARFRVRTVADYDGALAEIQRHPPDLVILDLNLSASGDRNGDALCRRIKESQQTESIPVIMVTAQGEFRHKIDSLRYGANDYVLKAQPDSEDALRLEEELVERVRNALRLRIDNRDGNPLTGLPGNARIERELSQRLAAVTPFAFLFIDIDHFKAYNDYYGYRRGDEAIRRTADLLTRVVWQHGDPTDFVGHVGGDDFVVMTTPARADRIAEALVQGFEGILELLFDAKEYQARSFTVEGRTGAVESFRLMSLTIALVTNENEALVHPAQVNDRAMELKKYGKSQPGSFVARERRGSA